MNENKFELGQELLVNKNSTFVVANIVGIIFTGNGVFYRVGAYGIFK